MNNQEFKTRRRLFLDEIGKGAIAIVAAAKEYLRNGDTNYPYRQASDFYYLTGFAEPEAIAVFIPGRKEGEYILFNREHDPEQEIFTGRRAGQKDAIKKYGADQAFPISSADTMLPDLILGKRHLYFDIGRDTEFDERVLHWVNVTRSKIRTGVNAPDDFSHVGKITHEMRLRSTEHEIALTRKSANIAAKAHLRAMRACKPGMFEYQLEAELYYEYIRNGGRVPAFEPIVASGANACILHYVQNDAKLKDGDLVLIDAGVDYQYYASDITRTFPVGKKFTPSQRAIYQAVLDTQLAVIKKIKPGVRWHELQETSEQVISEKLLKLGLLKGKLKDILAKKTYKRFYMHRIGHWLGIDTHDVGKYAIDEEWRLLEPGMIFTVEPGIYIPAQTKGVDKKWWNIGIRIEDDILVTEKGAEVLTSAVPKTIAEIEAIRS